MAVQDAEARLRLAGFSEDEIEEMLGDGDEPDVPTGTPQPSAGPPFPSPRKLSEHKANSRYWAAEAAKNQATVDRHNRQSKFDEAITSLPEADRALVSFDDVADVPEVTPTFLRAVALQKAEEQRQSLEAEAKRFNFPDADSYQQAMSELAERAQAQAPIQQSNQQALEAQSNIALGAPAATTPSSIRAQARQLADQGDLEGVARLQAANPQAFKMRLGETGPE